MPAPLRGFAAWLVLCGLGVTLFPHSAAALPSFSRQTGDDCAACHIGGYGPQLTPHGIQFKLTAYSDGKAPSWLVPLSAQLVGSYTNTAKGQDGGAAPHYSDNGNLSLDMASAYVAGKLADGAGVFSQFTWSEPGQTLSWDMLDLRWAHTFRHDGADTIVGLSLNNAPALQDPWNTLPAQGFPYVSSMLTPGYFGEPVLAGTFDNQVLGLTGYLQWHDWVYLEAGAYRGLPARFLSDVGIKDGQVIMGNTAPYWRAGISHSFHHQYASVGLVGFYPAIRPDPGSTALDRYHDIGVDASYQFLGTRRHTFTANARFLYEKQNLYASYAAGNAANASDSLHELNLNLSYYFRNTYGVSVGEFTTSGTPDSALYAPAPISGSLSGRPDSTGTIFQLDYTPWGKETSWLAPWANLRLGLQYTLYSRFNGAHDNYDGAGRNAADNNTLFLFLATAF